MYYGIKYFVLGAITSYFHVVSVEHNIHL